METLLEITRKYNLKEIEDRILELQNQDIKITIAFLGEFSSGKSSLINSLLGKKILPTMDKPTSKRIVEIEAKDVDKIIPYKITTDGLIPITMLDFSDLSITPGEEKIYLEIPFNDFFKEHYIIVDTPGIDSMEKMDVDITFGYLSYLDGAIICQDIQQGTLPQSLLNFLLRPEIKLILNNFIFAITKADLKSKNAREKIRNDVINQLEHLKKKYNLNFNNIKDKIVLTSIKEDISELKATFRKFIILNKEKLQITRKKKKLNQLKNEVVNILKEHKNHLSLSLDDIEEKEQELENNLNRLIEKELDIKHKFQKLEYSSKQTIREILINAISSLANINSEEDLLQIERDIQSQIINTINKNIDSILGKDFIIANSYINLQLEKDIKTILNFTELGKKIGTFIFMDIVLPGSGISGAIEGGTAVAIREITKVDVNQIMEKNTLINKEVKNKTKNLLERLGMIIQNINPVEYIFDFIKEKWIENDFESKIPRLTDNISHILMASIKLHIDNIVDNIKLEINSQRRLLKNLLENKESKIDKFINYINSIDNDINRLIDNKINK